MEIKNVTVAGGGVLGSQIAYQSAYKGFDVTVWVRSEASIERAKPKFERLLGIYLNTLETMKTDARAYCRGLAASPDISVEEIDLLKKRAEEAFASITFTTSFEEAAGDADLVIEAIAEDPAQKIDFYGKLAEVMRTRPSSSRTPRRCSRACSPRRRAGPRNTSRCTSPTRSGATTPPRSWGTRHRRASLQRGG